jgi:hypothetical protein
VKGMVWWLDDELGQMCLDARDEIRRDFRTAHIEVERTALRWSLTLSVALSLDIPLDLIVHYKDWRWPVHDATR